MNNDYSFLIKDSWKKEDIDDFLKFLYSLSKGEKSSIREQKIVNTKIKCIAVDSKNVDTIVNNIYKGNFISFIDLFINDNLTSLLITGKLIAKIKDFEVFKEKLQTYLTFVDNWCLCDCLKLKVKNNEQNYLNLSKTLIKSKNTYDRRFALIILFKLINEKYIDEVLSVSLSIFNEREYYVNMANAWLIAECFIKFREKTITIIENKKLNDFTHNKAISKCCDSFRVNVKDKTYLKSLKIKVY